MTHADDAGPSNGAPRARTELGRFFRAALVDPVEPERPETASALIRRRVAVAVTAVMGAVALGLTLAIRPGDVLFYPAMLGVAAVWAGGALASGRLRLGRARTRAGATSRSVLQGVILGGVLLAVFLAGAVAVARIPVLRGPVDALLDHARFGSFAVVTVLTAVNGVAEELFFRGAVFAALPARWRVAGTTLLYAATTLFSGVPLLTFAAACMGVLTAFQRRVTGGVLGPIATHLTWSIGMLWLLPFAFAL